jgi:hypothetical protein
VVVALISSWSSIPGSWRWPLVGVFVYWTIVTPITIARGLRTYWSDVSGVIPQHWRSRAGRPGGHDLWARFKISAATLPGDCVSASRCSE